MKTLVVGLGNPLLGDAGAGCRVAAAIARRLPEAAPVEVTCLSLGGIGLMEHLIGCDHVILVDALEMDAPPGSISVLKLSQLPNYSGFRIHGAHDVSLQKAMELGKDMGAHLPDDVVIVGIATERIHAFSECLSPPVEQVVPVAVNIVLNLLEEISMGD